MSFSPLPTPTSAHAGSSSRVQVSERISTSVEATALGVGATVSLSGQALHALEQAGEFMVDGAEDLALGVWHGVQAAASGVELAGETVADAVEGGLHEVFKATKATAEELGHYAAIGGARDQRRHFRARGPSRHGRVRSRQDHRRNELMLPMGWRGTMSVSFKLLRRHWPGTAGRVRPRRLVLPGARKFKKQGDCRGGRAMMKSPRKRTATNGR
jgi:hypothetical protein